MHILSTNIGQLHTLRVGERLLRSAIGKRAVTGPIEVGRLGLAGDTQADDSLHGGLDKAVYAYPSEHYPLWQSLRQQQGVSLFDEPLPPGFMGENLTLCGLLEQDLWVGDSLHFADCVLRVTAPREPCGKFAAVMGWPGAGQAMLRHGACGVYLAVSQPGRLQAGDRFEVVRGSRSLGIVQALQAKRLKHGR